MKVFNPANNLLEELASFLFLQFLLFYDVIKQLASANILHDKKELLGSLNNFEELNNVWVSDQFENVNLASHSLNVGFFRYFPFF